MTEEQNSKILYLGIFPKCPFYKPVPLFIILVLMAFGTTGIYKGKENYVVVYSKGFFLVKSFDYLYKKTISK